MKNLILTFSFTVFPLLSLCSNFDQCDFFMYKGHTYFETSVRGCEKPVVFLFDLGTDHFTISYRLASEMSQTSNDTLEIRMGSIHVKYPLSIDNEGDKTDSFQRMYMKDLLEGKIYGGIMGNVVFNNDYIILDYSSNKFYRERRPNLRLKHHTPLPDEQWASFIYDSKQIFVSCKSGDSIIGYFHLDNGIPHHSLINYRVAVNAGFKDLRNLPNHSGKLVSDTFYNEQGIPTHIRSGVRMVTNHQTPARCQHFVLGTIDLGLQFFITMDTDLNQDVFHESNVHPIVGSIGFYTMKDHQVHIDFETTRVAIINNK